jgi:hypothetical protein
VAALLALHLVFVLPDRVGAFGWTSVLRLPVELPIVVAILLASPPRRWPLVRSAAAAALALIVAIKVADIAAQASLGRPFHPMLDVHLVGALFELLAGAVGRACAVALAMAAVLAWIASMVVAYRAIGTLRAPERLRSRMAAAAAVSAIVVGVLHASASAGWAPAITTADTSRSARAHLQVLRESLADRERFQAEPGDDAFAQVDSERLLARLRGIDVLFLFVESYGRSTLERQPYAPVVQRTLGDFTKAAEAAGFHSRSAWATAPVHGGQSWLAHGTLLAGSRLDSQRRYESLIASDRPTLVGDFRRAGWRTLAVLPATRRPWPEGRFFGFDRIYVAKDLGYAGEAFNWITMPDQYTLSALQRLELERPERSAIMAVVALVSSHAPWTPIPSLVEWGAVGDGSVFTRARSGDPPAIVWLDPARVREQYLRSIEYVLRTLQSFVVDFGRDDQLFVIVGDHQPAGIVSGDDASFDVPIHLLAREPRLLDALAGSGWSRGMRPDANASVWPMEAIRERFLDAFTRPSVQGAPGGHGTNG